MPQHAGRRALQILAGIIAVTVRLGSLSFVLERLLYLSEGFAMGPVVATHIRGMQVHD